MTKTLCLLFLLALPSVVSAQTYVQRATLAQDATFQQRLRVGVTIQAVAVLLEPPATPKHDVRLQLAALAMRNPNAVVPRVSFLLASALPLPMNQGNIVVPTDEAILTALEDHWSTLSDALVGVSLSAGLIPIP